MRHVCAKVDYTVTIKEQKFIMSINNFRIIIISFLKVLFTFNIVIFIQLRLLC